MEDRYDGFLVIKGQTGDGDWLLQTTSYEEAVEFATEYNRDRVFDLAVIWGEVKGRRIVEEI